MRQSGDAGTQAWSGTVLGRGAGVRGELRGGRVHEGPKRGAQRGGAWSLGAGVAEMAQAFGIDIRTTARVGRCRVASADRLGSVGRGEGFGGKDRRSAHAEHAVRIPAERLGLRVRRRAPEGVVVIGLSRAVRVYAYVAPVDMRKSYDGLSAVVRNELRRDVLQGELFLFAGKDRRRAKVLVFDGTGLCVYMNACRRGDSLRSGSVEAMVHSR